MNGVHIGAKIPRGKGTGIGVLLHVSVVGRGGIVCGMRVLYGLALSGSDVSRCRLKKLPTVRPVTKSLESACTAIGEPVRM
jgi:hypothetical protein